MKRSTFAPAVPSEQDMRRISALLVALTLTSGCAHRQLTNRQLATGGAVVVGIAALLWLAVAQCRKSAAFCDNSPSE